MKRITTSSRHRPARDSKGVSLWPCLTPEAGVSLLDTAPEAHSGVGLVSWVTLCSEKKMRGSLSPFYRRVESWLRFLGFNIGALRESLQGLNKRGNDFEEIGGNAVIGDFEDGRIRVFINGHDALRAFHAYKVLDGA